MPYSEEEFESSDMQEPRVSNMSKAELRKSHKPMMEKRRRARINHCLNEIKSLILEAMNKDPARHSKLEKADILEMAVKHLQNVQRQQLAIAVASDPAVLRKFKSGFNDCAAEIDKFMDKSESADLALKRRVNTHLQKCINGLEQVAQFTIPTVSGLPLVNRNTVYVNSRNSIDSDRMGDQNNNPSIQIPQGIQLIPSRLPTGELALLVPNSNNISYFPTQSLPQRSSAFVTVVPKSTDNNGKSFSPPPSPTEPRGPSPKGFRSIHHVLPCNLPKPKPSYPGEDHQVPQITSTVANTEENKHHFVAPLEVKSMKFPIHHKYQDKERKVDPSAGIRKVSEPLCIITNQGERYKQAQQKEDSAHYEENLVPMRGVKRAFEELPPASTISIPQEAVFGRPTKVIKYSHQELSTAPYTQTSITIPQDTMSKEPVKHEKNLMECFVPFSNIAGGREESSSRRENLRTEKVENIPREQNADSNDMWRPW